MRDEIRLLCSGTATPASSLVPKGLALVDRLRGIDRDFGYQFWQVSDTQSIEVRISNGNATVKIFDADEESNGVCPRYQSGMLQRCTMVSRTDQTTGATLSGLWSFKPSSAYASANKLSREWQVGKYGAVQTWITPDPGGYGAGIPIPIPWSGQGFAQTASIKPGLYSGKMRHVVQVLLGSDTNVNYGYGFSWTNGIIPAGQNDWLVEITASGVRAMRLPVCRSSVPPDNTLGYVPTGKGFPTGDELTKALQAGTVRTLMTESSLAEVYAKSPFSPVFGWAFNYDGTKASTVVYGNASEGARYRTSWLYTIHFSIGKDGPETATLTMDMSDRIVNAGFSPISQYAKGVFKVPYEVNGTQLPVDFGPADGWLNYEPEVCEAPLHVWYKPTGEQVMVKYRNGIIEVRRPTDEKRRYSPNRNDDQYFDLSPEFWANYEVNMNVEFVEYASPADIDNNYYEQTNQQISISIGPSPNKERHTPIRHTYSANASTGTVYELSFAGGYAGIADMRAWKLMRMKSKSENGRHTNIYTSVIIPVHDREAAIYGESETISVALKTEGFETRRASGAYTIYRIDSRPKPPWVWRDDGMPMNFLYMTTGEFSTSADSIKYFFPFDNTSGDSFGGFLKGSFGGFGGRFGSTSLPSTFSTPDGFAGGDSALAEIQPHSGYEVKYQTYTRKVKKVLVTNYTQINFDKNYGPAPDEFEDSPTARYLPDGDFFSAGGVIYPLIQSWNGELRYSPPKIGALEDFSKSSFGDYGDPHPLAKSTINFVGDA